MRIRLIFSKLDPMRYTGHLDLFRAWERTIRRAGLPLAYSQGFNPRPRINLASALPLGFTSTGEVMDIWLEEYRPLKTLKIALEDALPPGLSISEIYEIETTEPSLQSQLVYAEYKIIIFEVLDDLDNRIEEILSKNSLPRERRGKTYDLRPLILSAMCLPSDDNYSRIHLHVTAHEGATGRPDEFLLALGIDPTNTRIERTMLEFQKN